LCYFNKINEIRGNLIAIRQQKAGLNRKKARFCGRDVKKFIRAAPGSPGFGVAFLRAAS